MTPTPSPPGATFNVLLIPPNPIGKVWVGIAFDGWIRGIIVRSLLDGAVLAVRVIYARRSDLHDGFRT